MHSDIDTVERVEIIRDLRLGKFDVLVGINLLREGLDMPEVSLVAILDADKEGFLRSETSLIQTVGRAARNLHGHAILYADKMTGSMQRAMDEMARRREIQLAHNETHGIEPKGIQKRIADVMEGAYAAPGRGGRGRQRDKQRKVAEPVAGDQYLDDLSALSPAELKKRIAILEEKMYQHAKDLEFEAAAQTRDELALLKQSVFVESS